MGHTTIIVGLVVLVGLIIQRKPLGHIVSGTIKTMFGMTILTSGFLIGGLVPIHNLFTHVLNIQSAVIPYGEILITAAFRDNIIGPLILWTVLFSFGVNILIARFTKVKYIYLTTNITLYAAIISTGILFTFPFLNQKKELIVLIASLITGSYMAFSPALTAPFVEKITGNKDFVLGHSGTLSYAIAGFLGQFIGKPEDSAEKKIFPKRIEFFHEPLVIMAIFMFILFLILCTIGIRKGIDIDPIIGGSPWWIYCIIQSLSFSGGISIILLGTRMVLSDLTPAFRYVSEKIVPEAIPSLDCPAIFPFAPNSLILGYLSSLIAGILVMFLQIIGKGTLGAVILPSMIIHFFIGGPSGIFGNATGGWKGALLGGFLSGVIAALLNGFAYTASSAVNVTWQGISFGDSDMGFIGAVLAFIRSL